VIHSAPAPYSRRDTLDRETGMVTDWTKRCAPLAVRSFAPTQKRSTDSPTTGAESGGDVPRRHAGTGDRCQPRSPGPCSHPDHTVLPTSGERSP
jgi:hypothetical protein